MMPSDSKGPWPAQVCLTCFKKPALAGDSQCLACSRRDLGPDWKTGLPRKPERPMTGREMAGHVGVVLRVLKVLAQFLR